MLFRSPTSGARVLLLVGSGDNGGDTLHAGAELAREGIDVAFVQTGSRIHEAGEAAALAAGVRHESADRVGELAAGADVILDGILGIGSGTSPALRGTARKVVAAILPLLTGPDRALVVAVDQPSGIGTDDGSVPDPVVLPADVTVTFGEMKAGLLLSPGAELAGRIVLVDIGLGPEFEGVEPLVQ